MDWLTQIDSDLTDRFIEVELAKDQDLLADILFFCEECKLLIDFLEHIGARPLVESVSFARRKWRLRLAFYTGPLPPISVKSLSSKLTSELVNMGFYEGHSSRFVRRSLADQFVRGVVYRVLSTSCNASGPRDAILGELSSASHNALLSQSALEIRLAGYATLDGEITGLMAWNLRIRTATLPDINVYVSEDSYPSDICRWLLDVMTDDENIHESTPSEMAAA